MNYKQLCITSFSLSIMLVIFVQFGYFHTMDSFIYEWTKSMSNSTTDTMWRIFTLVGETEALAILSLVIIIFLIWQRKWKESFLFLFLMGIGVVLTFCLKVLFQRDRPDGIEYIDFWGFGQEIISYSFPSGHAVKSLLLLGFIIWLFHHTGNPNKLKPLIYFLLVFAIAMCGIGQVFLHEHFLSDSLGGFIIGVTILFFSFWMYSLWEDRRVRSSLKSNHRDKKEIAN